MALQGPVTLEDLEGGRTFSSVSRLTSVCRVGTCLHLQRGQGTNGANSGVLWQIPVWWIWCTGRSPGVSSMPLQYRESQQTWKSWYLDKIWWWELWKNIKLAESDVGKGKLRGHHLHSYDFKGPFCPPPPSSGPFTPQQVQLTHGHCSFLERLRPRLQDSFNNPFVFHWWQQKSSVVTLPVYF